MNIFSAECDSQGEANPKHQGKGIVPSFLSVTLDSEKNIYLFKYFLVKITTYGSYTQ
jgi:hypothetical protein